MFLIKWLLGTIIRWTLSMLAIAITVIVLVGRVTDPNGLREAMGRESKPIPQMTQQEIDEWTHSKQ